MRLLIRFRADAQRAQIGIEQWSTDEQWSGPLPTPFPHSGADSRPLIPNVFNFIAYAHKKFRSDLPFNPKFAPWWSQLHHVHLHHVAMMNELSKDPTSDKLWDYTCWTRRSLVRLCEELIKKTHPSLAVTIVESLVEMPRGEGYDTSATLEQRECVGTSTSQR